MSSQPQLPPAFRSGDQLYAADLQRINEAVAFALDSMIVGGDGIFVQKVAGRYIFSKSRDRQRSAAAESHLQITRKPNPNYSGTAEAIPTSFFVSWGTINSVIPDNIDDAFTLPTAGNTLHVYLTINLSDASPYAVSSVEIGTAATLPASPVFGSDGTWPEYVIYRIGQISVSAEGVVGSPINVGNGSLQVSVYLLDWDLSSVGPQLRFALSYSR